MTNKALEDLYAEVPAFQCSPGCSLCCGIAPIAPAEIDNIASWIAMNGVKVRTMGIDLLTCPYVVDDRCSIHPVRPLICRLFGVVEDELWRCPEGGVADKLITKVEADSLIDKVFTTELGGKLD